MRAGVTFPHALRVLALGAFPGTCPNCEQHSMFRGFYTMYEVCPQCGVRYERESGAWLGAVALGYGAGALCVVALGLIELIWHPLAGIGVHPLATIMAVSLAVTALAYRPAKGAWFALLWLYEFTDEPSEQSGAP
jgi:uncharacterized protein (DUF983 family)